MSKTCQFELKNINDWEEDLKVSYESTTDFISFQLYNGRANINKSFEFPKDILEKVYKKLREEGMYDE